MNQKLNNATSGGRWYVMQVRKPDPQSAWAYAEQMMGHANDLIGKGDGQPQTQTTL